MAFTDEPEADISAHRWNAKVMAGIGLFVMVAGGLATVMGRDLVIAVTGLAVGELYLIGSHHSKLQALRWEVNNIHHPDSGGSGGDLE